MKQLEEKFEKLLLKSRDADLIDAYANLKEALNKAMEDATRVIKHYNSLPDKADLFCGHCGKRKNFKGDGTIEQLCIC